MAPRRPMYELLGWKTVSAAFPDEVEEAEEPEAVPVPEDTATVFEMVEAKVELPEVMVVTTAVTAELAAEPPAAAVVPVGVPTEVL